MLHQSRSVNIENITNVWMAAHLRAVRERDRRRAFMFRKWNKKIRSSVPGQRKTRLACRASSWTSGWKLWILMALRIWLMAMFNSSRLAVLREQRGRFTDDLWKTTAYSFLSCMILWNQQNLWIETVFVPTFPGKAGGAVCRRWWRLQPRMNVSSSSPRGWRGGRWTAAENTFYLQTGQSAHSLSKTTKQ